MGDDLAAAGPALGYIVVFGAVIAVLAWNTAVQRLGAPTAVLFNNLVPITAFVIAIAGGYAPNAYELGGAALAIVSLAAVTLLNRASAPARASRRRPARVEPGWSPPRRARSRPRPQTAPTSGSGVVSPAAAWSACGRRRSR